MKTHRTTRPLFALALCLLYWPAAACQTRSGAVAVADDGAQKTKAAPSPAGQDGAPAATVAAEDPFAKIPRMKVEELAEALRRGRVVVVDVRPAEAFAEEHIRGAVSLPEEEVVERGGALPKDKLVVVYCA